MLQLVYNEHTCNHVMCPHFHHPLWDTFTTTPIMIPIDTISMATSVPLLNYYYLTIL
jgi:hypothetical protein